MSVTEHRLTDMSPALLDTSCIILGCPGDSVVKNPPGNEEETGDVGLISGSRRFPGVGNGNPLQYSHLEKSTDREAWWATVLGVAKRQT